MLERGSSNECCYPGRVPVVDLVPGYPGTGKMYQHQVPVHLLKVLLTMVPGTRYRYL